MWARCVKVLIGTMGKVVTGLQSGNMAACQKVKLQDCMGRSQDEKQ